MVLNDFIVMKITKKNIGHYSLFYEGIKCKDIIKVSPENLQQNSNVFVDVKCDICGTERTLKYQAYTKNIRSCPEHPIYTCDKCSHIKIRAHNQKKWGVDYFSQTEEYTEKFKGTMKERWGVEYAMQSDVIKEKSKKTNLENFGYENPFMDSDLIKRKFMEKWGVDHPMKVPDIREKIKSTNLENFGYDNPLSSPDIREKIKKTMVERYGSVVPYKSDMVRDFQNTRHPNYIEYIGSNISRYSCDLGKDHFFEIDSIGYHNRVRSNIPLCTECNPIGSSSSIKERELLSYISSVYSGEVVHSYRDGLEIDVYLPELKMGFEFNGLYWHSEGHRDKRYHRDKTDYFAERGIRVFHIWEDDWDHRREIVESQISNWVGSNVRRIFARKCSVREIGKVECRDFLNRNHIQGNDRSSVKLGLYMGDDLVSAMTFDRFEGRKRMEDGEWNLSRFCNRLGVNVVGGASKMLSHFVREYSPKRIVSYADMDWSQGDLYFKIGFSMVSKNEPDYKYVLDGKRCHKSRLRKSRLKYDCSESEYISMMGISRIWDCGKMKFELGI